MESWSLTQVLDTLSNSVPATLAHTRAMAELVRRAMEVDQASLKAQQKSADAAADAAKSSRSSARGAWVAVVVSALSLIVSIAASYFHK